MSSKRIAFVFSFSVLLLALLAFAPVTLSQQTLGGITGTVTDASGGAIAETTVTLVSDGTSLTRSTKTSEVGSYDFVNLPIGAYTLTFSHDGFESQKIPAIRVQADRTTTLNATLKVGQVGSTVTVEASPLLNSADTTNGYILEKAEIQSVPLPTGSFTGLAILSPGVNAELPGGTGVNSGLGNQPIWANGQRDTSNTFQVNGADSTNLFNGKSSSGANSQRYNFNIGSASTAGGSYSVGTSVYGSNGNSLPSPPPEFTQELRVNTSMYDAQQGATSGAQIDVNTNSGTNTWHGQFYGTYANNLLNASPFYFKQAYDLTQDGIGAFPSSLVNPWMR
ncbi:MAG TPA: carboxypeptidase-like regulatory domain-containing protein, partial [Dongiaceae bacterium]|nr:carboxypeptidase-like regulatory domain-containing protein [Dongiaceae bacterium]